MRPGLPATPEGAEAQIARKLRSYYLSVQDEPIPARFLELIEKLDAVEQQSELQMGGGDR
nr:NepR family anti-sigma factor [Rhizobium sp. ARZ01]